MSQGYISEVLFHFVGKNLRSEEEQYELLKKIIEEGWITSPPHMKELSYEIKIDSNSDRKLEEMFNPNCVCFADIPIKDLSLHSSKYSKFGIGFSRDFLILKGANPVFYIEKNSTIYKNQLGNPRPIILKREDYYQEYCSKTVWYFFKYLNYINKNENPQEKNTDLADTWEILIFLINIFSYLKPWDDSLGEIDPRNFYFEREWRALNNINFNILDIKVICLPKSYKKVFYNDFPLYRGDIETV
jgi:hypothetical protein